MHGNLDSIPTDWFCDFTSENPEKQKKAIDARFKALKEKLQKKQHVIVGHNLFMDLGFLYATFIGPLPPTLLGFQQAINEVFPVVFDTKYVASEGQDSMSPQTPLKDLLKPFKRTKDGPMVALHEKHNKYGGREMDHEAGFDSTQ